MTDDPRALAHEMDDIGARGEASPAAIARLLDGLRSDATWAVQSEVQGLWRDEVVTETEEVWRHAASAIERLGAPAKDAVAARIEAGEWRLLARAERFGPRIVAAAARLLETGPDACVSNVLAVLDRNADAFGPAEALAHYLRAFDRRADGTAALLKSTWPRFATPEGRAAVLARWPELRAWIEARLDGSADRARHLVALLAVAPKEDALPLLRAALVAPREVTFEPLLAIDVERARDVLAVDAEARAWAEPIARRIAGGGACWESSNGDQPLDCALVTAFASDEVHELLLSAIRKDADGGHEVYEARWRALAPYVRGDTARFWHAAQAAIRHQLLAAGPGVPAPRFALRTIGELDPERMTELVVERIGEIRQSKNAYGFIELLGALGPRAAAAKRVLAAWSRDLESLRTEVEQALARIDGSHP